jgi:hypothetical protein
LVLVQYSTEQRSTLYLWGSIWMCAVLLVVGGVSTVNNIAASWAAGVMLLLWSIAYQFTVSATMHSLPPYPC